MEASTAPVNAVVSTIGELPEKQQHQLHDQQQQQQFMPSPLPPPAAEATAISSSPQAYNAVMQLAHLMGQSSPVHGSDQVAMALKSQMAQPGMADPNAALGQQSSSLPASTEALAAVTTALPQMAFPEFDPSYVATESQGHLQGVSTSCLDATQLSALGLIPEGSYVGLVKSFNPIKGFGFINSQVVGGDLFFHRKELPTEIQSGDISSLQGLTVAFELRTGEGGRARAGKVQLLPTDGQPAVGTIKSYSERNGYGFIATSSLSRDVHFKTSDMPPELHSCTGVELAGKRVIFQVEVLKDGKLKAMQLQLAASLEPQVVPLRLPVPAAVTALGGVSTAGGGCSAQEKAQLRGFVTTYDAVHGVGILQAPGVADALRFDGFGLELLPGQLVCFILHWFPDGTAEARSVAPVAPVPQTDALFNGGDGKRSAVAALDPTQSLAGAPPLKQQRWDVSEALPGMTAMESFPGMTAMEALPGLAVGATPAGASQAPPPQAPVAAVADLAPAVIPPQLMSGTSEQATARLGGAVKSFNMAKGFGFIACQGIAEDIFFLRSELPGGLATGHVEQGQLVGFDIQLSPDGRYRASRISFE